MLLTEKGLNKTRRLRSPEGLREALRSILAVTFTVKATAEMKLRIVEKLAALATADKTDPSKYHKIDYLKDFLEEVPGATASQIAYLAQDALRELLLHFSDFKVQTIDAFFQSVLHTFAYEASIDENFNMEIDTDFITSVGLDAALDAVITSDRGQTDPETLYWLRKMMKGFKKASDWNVFAKQQTGKNLYGSLVNNAKNLEKEDFLTKRLRLEEYFQNLKKPFRKVVEEVTEANLAPLRQLHEARKQATEQLVEELGRCYLQPSDLYQASDTSKKIAQCLSDFDKEKPVKIVKPKTPADFSGNNFLSGEGKSNFRNVRLQHSEINDTRLNDIRSAYEVWLDACDTYENGCTSGKLAEIWNTWTAYLDRFPELMVVLDIAARKRDYLEATNTLEISDTTHILARIIGKDDAPFVYERIGARLDHYLIDEFQDTSRMQWANLYPLLQENDSRGEENLIIGDAKQSIYRFRNADYKLITNVVEKSFPKVRPYTSDKKPKDQRKENTNYRSSANVVKFNNYVFENIVNLQDSKGADFFNAEIKKIYQDVRQHIPEGKNNNPKGFVDIILYPTLSKEETEQYDKVGDTSCGEPGFTHIVDLILGLKERGYDFKDIGILVRTHDEGKCVIKAISQYNDQHPESQIRIISQENLLVASSLSVKIVIHALETMLKGLQTKEKKAHPEVPGPVDPEKLFTLLSSLQSQGLPSVTEAIIDKFVPATLRDADAPFIATFQDAVLDYSASHSNDVGSFLKWWKRKAEKLTINTPEDTDGVKIDTIHASKGLEYQCVIMPFANINFMPSSMQKEWKWVTPDHHILKSNMLPPYVPVATTSSLNDTFHADVWTDYCEEVGLDNLNKLYVGMTRAVKELYLFAPLKTRIEANAAKCLDRLLSQGFILNNEGEEETLEVIDNNKNYKEGTIEYRFGSPLTPEEIAEGKKERSRSVEPLSSYPVCSDRKLLQFQDANNLVRESPDEDPEETDPRAEGSLKHRIMQLIERPSDLDKAMLTVKVSGMADASLLETWRGELADAINSVAPYGWFDNDVRVLNERTLLRRGEKFHRPDRIVVKPDGKVEVVDYKFGAPRAEHKKQVKEYCELIQISGKFSSVEGYIWYVPLGQVVKV